MWGQLDPQTEKFHSNKFSSILFSIFTNIWKIDHFCIINLKASSLSSTQHTYIFDIMSTPYSAFYLCFLSLTVGLSMANPVANPSQLADCLYDNNHDFLSSGNLISTSEIEACTNARIKRDLPRIDPGPGYGPDEIISRRAVQASPLIVPGDQVAAKVNKRNLEPRSPPPVGFFDQVSEAAGEDPIPSNFLETGALDRDWSTPICNEVTKFDPHQQNTSGIFNHNIQGTHKKDLSLVHTGKFLHLLVTFTGADTTLLPQYDMVDLCKHSMHQAAQSYHELAYGAFGSQTVYSVVRQHRIQIQPTETTEQSNSQKRSTFGGPIGIINIQIGDQAKGLDITTV
ncbi:hypothetical protein LSUE1_G004419 [Lachnellula suecica]|uniref:Uncharacterized protein n=1 Tax=Lachnellula suecica TaxID=602035 RepID=A0A8T9CBS4_9HELO|nr:hypothetical protein LSUE1_G004419 [Lachnellula suecica]